MNFFEILEINVICSYYKWQEGHNILEQFGMGLSWLRKWFLSSRLNSNLFLINLMLSAGKSSHILGKAVRGNFESALFLAKGMYKLSSFLSSISAWPCLLKRYNLSGGGPHLRKPVSSIQHMRMWWGGPCPPQSVVTKNVMTNFSTAV